LKIKAKTLNPPSLLLNSDFIFQYINILKGVKFINQLCVFHVGRGVELDLQCTRRALKLFESTVLRRVIESTSIKDEEFKIC
jgi:hypothetical protein